MKLHIPAILAAMAISMIGAGALQAAEESATNKAHQQMMSTMDDLNKDMKSMETSNNTDTDFTRMMIRHHQAGIDMMQTEIDNGTDPKMKSMARKMMESQKKDLKKLQSWLDKNEKKSTS